MVPFTYKMKLDKYLDDHLSATKEDNMPNLKTICYKCPTVPMEIKTI